MAKQYDLEKVRQVYDKARQRSQAERYTLERDWFRNVLYFLGIQWILYSAQQRKWQPRNMKKWVPRPVTNKFYSIANTIMQVLSAKEPDVRARPGSDDPEDIAAAAVADKNFDVILKEANSDEARSIAAAWATLCGTAFFHPCYDNDPKHGTTFVQHLKCDKCGETFAPDMAGPSVPLPPPAPIPTDTGNPAMVAAGPNGGNSAGAPMPLPLGALATLEPPQMSEMSCPSCGSPLVSEAPGVGEELPNGRMKLEVFSPFEVFIDLEARSLDDVQEILVRRRYPLEVIRARFDNYELEGDNNSNVGGAIGLNLLRAIAYAAGNAMYGTGIASGRNIGDDQSITVDQLWKRPCKDFPDGLVAFYANEKLLNGKDISEGLPYKDRKDKPIWPWHILQFDRVPGRIFGKTPMDDVAPKQEQRNKLESLIQLIISRTAAPHWLIPKGIGITEITGEPGQILEGNWSIDPRLKPELKEGGGVQTSLIAWLEKIDKDMEEISGTFEVLRGSAPPGVTAGTALRLLLERANTRFTPVQQRLEKVWQNVSEDLLVIFQQNATEDRIAKIQGEGNTWEIARFSKADLNGAIDVVVEAGSAVPKSTVGEQAVIQDLATMMVIDPANPETQYKILERFGSTNLLGDTDLNIKAAQRENWRFANESKTPVVNPIIDSHTVHIVTHKKLCLQSDFDEMPEEQRNIMLNHIIEHMMAMAPPMPAGPPSAERGTPGAEGDETAENGGSAMTPNTGPQDSQQQPPMPGGPM